jgi:hypothetical protein
LFKIKDEVNFILLWFSPIPLSDHVKELVYIEVNIGALCSSETQGAFPKCGPRLGAIVSSYTPYFGTAHLGKLASSNTYELIP